MKLISIIILSILLTGCGLSAKRSFLGSWNETAESKHFVTDGIHGSQTLGYFTLKQDQYYWADQLDKCDLSLRYTNTTGHAVSFNFKISFQLRNAPRKHNDYNSSRRKGDLYNGYWTYTNAIVTIQPHETIDFGDISNRIVSIKEGQIYIRASNIQKGVK